MKGKDLKTFVEKYGNKTFNSIQQDKKILFDDLEIIIDVEAGLFESHYSHVKDIDFIIDSDDETYLLDDKICIYPNKKDFIHLSEKQYDKIKE